MKKVTFLLSLLIALTINVTAQIPNSGFENWEDYIDTYTSHTYQKPDHWVGSLPKNSAYSFSIQKNNESYPAGTGQYSMKIQADSANGVRGVALSNDLADSMKNWIPQPSFAINYRPTSLFLYYKSFPYGGDTIVCMVYFYKNGVVIGNPALGTTETKSSWTPLEMPMTYSTSDVPDSATILFVTGVYVQHSQSILFVDNLSFDGFITSVPEETTKNSYFRIFPNPASDVITLSTDSRNNNELIMNIFNVTGNLIQSKKLYQNQQEIDISKLNNGVYMIEIKTQEWSGMQKLIIEK